MQPLKSPVSKTYQQFLEKIYVLYDIYSSQGFSVRPRSSTPNAEGRFRALPDSLKARILSKLDADIEFHTFCMSRRVPLSSVRNVIDLFAYKHKLRIPDEVLETIHSKSVVEIYDHDLIQCYRSPNFFSFVSHSLEDLESRPYYELFKKSPEVEKKINGIAIGILEGRIREPDFKTMGKHRLWEINSSRKLLTQLKSAVVSPMFRESDGSNAGIFHVCSVVKQVEFTLINSQAALSARRNANFEQSSPSIDR